MFDIVLIVIGILMILGRKQFAKSIAENQKKLFREKIDKKKLKALEVGNIIVGVAFILLSINSLLKS